MGITAVLVLAAATFAVAQDRTITTAVSIEQDQPAAGAYTDNQVVQSGRQFFAVSFLPADGHGEGDNGPRSQQRIDLWSPSTPHPLNIPFLRLNGLDSQSCFACHNTAGTYTPEGEIARTQKPGGVGGAGDFAVALLGSGELADPLTHILRAPPRAFGSAYLQELALEMTGELLDIEKQATNQAAQQPGIPVTAPLSAKGCPTSCGAYGCQQLGSFAEVNAAEHPAKTTLSQQQKAISSSACPSGFFCMDLTNPGPLPPDFYPRLPANHDGTATDSEASPVIASYLALPASDQQAIVDFLETLTIPIP